MTILNGMTALQPPTEAAATAVTPDSLEFATSTGISFIYITIRLVATWTFHRDAVN
jgi:hypothetical protein